MYLIRNVTKSYKWVLSYFSVFTTSSTASVTQSSAPPSIPEDLMVLCNSDDSVQDSDYLSDASEMEVTPAYKIGLILKLIGRFV